MSPAGIAGAAIAMLIATVTLVTLFLNRDYNKGVIGAAIWFLLRHRVLRLLCPQALDPLTRRRVRDLASGKPETGSGGVKFPDLKTLLAKATPPRSGDDLAGISAASAEERVAAQMALSDLPLKTFLSEHVIPYEADEVTRLICRFARCRGLRSRRAPDRRRVSRLAAQRPSHWRDACSALAPGLTAGNGRGRFEDHAASGSGDGGRQDAAWSRTSAIPSGSPDGCPHACSPIIPPTIPRASPPASSTVLRTAAATR